MQGNCKEFSYGILKIMFQALKYTNCVYFWAGCICNQVLEIFFWFKFGREEGRKKEDGLGGDEFILVAIVVDSLNIMIGKIALVETEEWCMMLCNISGTISRHYSRRSSILVINSSSNSVYQSSYLIVPF